MYIVAGIYSSQVLCWTQADVVNCKEGNKGRNKERNIEQKEEGGKKRRK
jgi:hypothetical protein